MLRYRTRDITRLTTRAVRLRPHARAHPAHHRAQRRHADHPRRQRLSVADRGGAGRPAAHRAALPARRRAPRQPRPGARRSRGAPGVGADAVRAPSRATSRITSSRWSASPPTSSSTARRNPALAGQGGARARPAAERKEHRMAKRILTTYRQRAPARGCGRRSTCCCVDYLRETAGPHRHQAGLRRRRMRRLHGAGRRRAAAGLHHARRERRGHAASRRSRASPTRRPHEPAAAGVPRKARHAMRLLHARHGDERRGAAAPQRRAERSADPRGARPATCAAAPAT